MRSLAGLVRDSRKALPVQILLRRARLGTVRGDLRAAGVLSDPHRDRDPRASMPARSRPMIGPHCRLIELGSGASLKVRILLRGARPAGRLCAGRHLARAPARRRGAARRRLSACCRSSRSAPTTPARFTLPPLPGPAGKRVGFFPGSTIGNFEPDGGRRASCANCAELLGPDGEMLIGADLKKDAGDPRRGLQRPRRRQRRLQPQSAGAHQPRARRRFRYRLVSRTSRSTTTEAGRMELYLKSLADQTVTVAGRRFRFADGERIHTENSYKYAIDEFRALAARAGFAAVQPGPTARHCSASTTSAGGDPAVSTPRLSVTIRRTSIAMSSSAEPGGAAVIHNEAARSEKQERRQDGRTSSTRVTIRPAELEAPGWGPAT